jgi:hypothetical protein
MAYTFPQQAAPLRKGENGIASLTHHGRTFRFRTNPNEFRWSYTLNKRIDQTYGGRVIQLLGTRIDDFSLKAEAGRGGWDYINRMSKFLRDVMVDQRDGTPATFEYTTRGWKLNCYIASVPFQDAMNEVLREFEITMKVQEDVSGLMTRNSLSAELRRLMDGVGFQRSPYNDPNLTGSPLMDIIGDVGGVVRQGLDTYQDILQFATGGGGIYLPEAVNKPDSGLPGVGVTAPTPGR